MSSFKFSGREIGFGSCLAGDSASLVCADEQLIDNGARLLKKVPSQDRENHSPRGAYCPKSDHDIHNSFFEWECFTMIRSSLNLGLPLLLGWFRSKSLGG